jgi:hypothetical protein
MSNAADLKAKSRRQVVGPSTGTVFTIRKLTRTELSAAGLSVIIPVDNPRKDATTDLLAMARQGEEIVIAQTRHALENGVVEPRVVYGPEAETPEGAVHASWIAEDERLLFLSIMEFSGIANEQATKELKEYTKNAPGSEPSTASVADTGSSLTSSSETISDPAK